VAATVLAMPSRNIIKQYIPQSFFHVYNRGVNKQNTFCDAQDMHVFMGIFDRYLNVNSSQLDSNKLPYQKFTEIELSAYCIMTNHFHLLIHVGNDVSQLPAFMKAVSNSYTSYFNKKYERIGPLFQSSYKAVHIESDEQLAHITRYIHLNPDQYLEYKFSSLPAFLGYEYSAWLQPRRVIDAIGTSDYLDFLQSA
jgi:putative transposase